MASRAGSGSWERRKEPAEKSSSNLGTHQILARYLHLPTLNIRVDMLS